MTGIAIAVSIRRPELALPLAFASHFILDMVPHGKMDIARKIQFRNYLIIEAIAMTVLTIVAMFVFEQLWFLVGLCAVLAFLPDMLWPFLHNGRLAQVRGFRQFYWFHKRIQWSETKRGFLVELLYACVLVIFLVQATHAVQ